MTAMSAISANGSYVVVWEWENRPNRWRPYSPEVTQLLERAHNKKLNRIYLKDAEPLFADFYINMTTFQQCCEPTGTKYTVRREFYPHSSPAGKGAKWEWSGEAPGDWHTYDMEVQVVLEEAWSKGEKTIDISTFFPGCPYIMNFCNLTQVRKTTGFVRPMRRIQQAAYPMVKLTQAEVAAMVGRREERRRIAEEEVERRNRLNKGNKRSKSRDRGIIDMKGKKTMKNIVNTLLGKEHKNFMFGTKDHKDETIRGREGRSGRERRMSAPGLANSLSPGASRTLLEEAHDSRRDYSTLTHQRRIGHPSASEAGFPVASSSASVYQRGNQANPANPYRRFQDSSFSSFSDTSSMIRRPSIDTISTYLSHESMLRHRYGHASQNGSYYSSVGSQELLDLYGDEDSVFTEDSNEDGHYNARNKEFQISPSRRNYSRSSQRIDTIGRSAHRIDTIGRSAQRLDQSDGQISQQQQRHLSNGSSDRLCPPLDRANQQQERLDTLTTPSKRRLLFDSELQQTSTPNRRDITRGSTRSYSLSGNRVLSDPSLSFNRPHAAGVHQHSNSDVISTRSGVTRGTVRPYSQDLSELQESFERELYVNQRQLTEDIQADRQRQQHQRRHRYHYIDGDEESCGSTSPYDPTFTESMNPLPLPPKTLLGSHQSLLSNDKYGGSLDSPERPLLPSSRSLSMSHQSLARPASNQSGNRPPSRVVSPTHSVGFGKKPIPAPRTLLNSSSTSISPSKLPPPPAVTTASTVGLESYTSVSQQNLNYSNGHVEKLVISFSEFVVDPCKPCEICVICRLPLNHTAGYSRSNDVEKSLNHHQDSAIVALEKCNHKFHFSCVKILTENQNPEFGCTYIQCPTCGQILGDKFGDQPETGIMSYKVIPKGLPGFEDYHSIQITYNFQNGTQNKQHPNPGKSYIAIGFPKTAFLPDTEKGRRILALLEKAFNAGHTFTVSQAGDIVWGSIPHRTEFAGESVTTQLMDDILSHLNMLGIYS